MLVRWGVNSKAELVRCKGTNEGFTKLYSIINRSPQIILPVETICFMKQVCVLKIMPHFIKVEFQSGSEFIRVYYLACDTNVFLIRYLLWFVR